MTPTTIGSASAAAANDERSTAATPSAAADDAAELLQGGGERVDVGEQVLPRGGVEVELRSASGTRAGAVTRTSGGRVAARLAWT
ncbi:hypothetical protein BH09MYX1_BH09MYX1_64180 [soil metagenome]